MRIGMVGLGRMGANMTRRLTAGGIGVVAFDASEPARGSVSGNAPMRFVARSVSQTWNV